VGARGTRNAEHKVSLNKKVQGVYRITGAMVVHPMIPVPKAIGLVLRQAVLAVESRNKQNQSSSSGGGDEDGDIAGISSGRMKMVPIDAAPMELLGLRVARDIYAPEPGFPNFNASIMDGYAVCSSSKDMVSTSNINSSEWTHQVTGSVYAGPLDSSTTTNATASSGEQELPKAIYITTGAVVPAPFDCVVPIEVISENSDKTRICIKLEEGQTPENVYKKMKWIRPVGCDIAPNTIIVPKGQMITEAEIGVMVCCGIRQVPVQVPVKVSE
jgi:molybdopterin biosynthesis enzyme